MRVSLALLADYAVALPDGKLYVTGGGIRMLPFPAFPATQPRLAIAVGLELPNGEAGKPHTMLIQASGPTEDPIVKSVGISFFVPPDESESGGRYFHLVYNMEDLAFPVEGAYSFAVVIDGETLKELPLRVVKSGVVPAELEAATRVGDGYRAYLSGDAAGAEEVFRDVVTRFPEHGSGHNNLGFLLLQRGDAVSAKHEFERAQELAYGHPEFNAANVATALYVLGDAAEALEGFRKCLTGYLFRTEGVLFGITGDALFPVALRSASDYVALLSLNASWSAMRANDPSAAERYLRAAGAAEMSVKDDAVGKRFRASVDALRQLIEQVSR